MYIVFLVTISDPVTADVLGNHTVVEVTGLSHSAFCFVEQPAVSFIQENAPESNEIIRGSCSVYHN